MESRTFCTNKNWVFSSILAEILWYKATFFSFDCLSIDFQTASQSNHIASTISVLNKFSNRFIAAFCQFSTVFLRFQTISDRILVFLPSSSWFVVDFFITSTKMSSILNHFHPAYRRLSIKSLFSWIFFHSMLLLYWIFLFLSQILINLYRNITDVRPIPSK